VVNGFARGSVYLPDPANEIMKKNDRVRTDGIAAAIIGQPANPNAIIPSTTERTGDHEVKGDQI
jgi:hypothetical protein